jgi:hypothetical protein
MHGSQPARVCGESGPELRRGIRTTGEPREGLNLTTNAKASEWRVLTDNLTWPLTCNPQASGAITAQFPGHRAPIRARVQHELAEVRAEQDTRARTGQPAAPQRHYDAAGLTAGELERTRRELAASLALAPPGSPARAPIQAQMAAIDAELAARDTQPT